jgi:single-strand DNA-binding protein
VNKGSKVYVSGKFTTRSYEDQSGQKKYVTEIVADEMQMLDSKQSDGQQQPQQRSAPRQAQPAPPADDFDADGIPF